MILQSSLMLLVVGVTVVACVTAVADYSAVEGILPVASDPADPGVHILVGGLTYWIVE
jgi:hypothetical protein